MSYSNFRAMPYCPTCKKYGIFASSGAKLLKVVDSNCTFQCKCGVVATLSYSVFKERRTCTLCWKKAKKEFKQAFHYDEMVKNRTIIGYTDWREQVLSEHPMCPCGAYMDLIAHHILSYTDYPNKRLDIQNGFTLCKKHHESYHSLHGRDGNLESLMYFIENEL
jgi:hypothetical protein